MNNIVKFPGLNLTLNLNQIAFKIFGVGIYWYSIIIVLATIIRISVLKKEDGLFDMKFDNILGLLIFLIPISIISARIYYVLFNFNYYLSNPIKILDFRNGGLAIYGGIIGGIITCIFYCKIKKINLLDLLDYLAIPLVLGQAIGRWGNFVNVEAYGTKTDLPWRMGIFEMGKYVEVHPTFFYESLACIIIFIILMAFKNKREFKGQITCTYLLLYSLERTFVEYLRTDSLMLGKIKISQMLSILIFIGIVIVFIYSKVVAKSPKNGINTDKNKKIKQAEK